MAILAEVAHLIETRRGSRMMGVLLADLGEGTFSPECGEEDFPRIRSLTERHSDLPLGFADGAVIACAERRGGAVLTFDLRHFGVVSREGRIGIVPERLVLACRMSSR